MSESFQFPDEPIRYTHEHMDRLLAYCHDIEASDITIQTGEPVYAEIYGKLHRITRRPLSNTEVGEMLNGIYGPNGTTQILTGNDVDTHYEYRPNRTDRYRYRVNGSGCQVAGHDAIQLTIRTIPSTPPQLSDLNIEPEILDAIAPHQGVVYVTGATGSGKSTLLASIIRDLTEKPDGNRKVVTYESPIEFVYDEFEKPSSIVSQAEIPRHLPTFAGGVRNALRRKPGMILVGEARDTETIAAVIEAALTGHPVYTTLHSNGVSETVRRLVTSFPADERHGRTIDILETIRLVIWQKLVPTVDGKRVALREYLVFTEELRDMMLDADPDNITGITRRLLKKHGRTMLEDAEKKYKEGIIPEREYKLIAAGARNADKDAGI